MMPSNLKYPEFVPDQLLTSENLNDMFRYLDEQGRMTRTNLVGIGIVCGLEVETAADGTSIVVTKGTGITSEGHLVAQDQRTYTQSLPFDAAKELFYDPFLTAANLKQFDLWELKQSAAVPGAAPLTQAFLDGNGVDNNKKVVLLFVELMQEQNKNCNPESCDDKGITIRVNLRPLLVRKQDADSFGLRKGISVPNLVNNNNFATLVELRMRRFDVTATPVVSAAGLYTAYKKILTTAFLSSVEHALSLAWSRFKAIIGDEFQNANPFVQLQEKFAFVNNGNITAFQLLQLQYIYDHFSDLIAAYEEFRRTGMEVLGICCPDAGLFPRHLLLDLAVKDANTLHSAYRHHFRPAPIFQKADLLGRLRSLFRRLALMVQNFKVPNPTGTKDNPDDTIRVTPSRLDPAPLSAKAIPYYYQVNSPAANPLFRHWSYEKTLATDPTDNLSYHAGLYATKDFVSRPLLYDLEPYNFLRVEGHLGKSFSHVINNLKRVVRENRLPVDVIGLCLGTDASDTEIVDPKVLQDIQVQYEVLRTEVICCLKRQVGYWGKLVIRDNFKYGKLGVATNLFSLFSPSLGALNFAGVNLAGAMAGAGTPTTGTATAPTRGVSAGTASGPATGAAARAVTGGAAGAAVGASTGLAAGAAAGGELGNMEYKAGLSRKGDLVLSILGEQAGNVLVKDYLKYQEAGDFNLSRIPAPTAATAVLDEAAISHFALQIIDEISEVLVLLEAENPLTLDVDALTSHGKALEKILDSLLLRVEKEIVDKRPFQKIKAYLPEAQHVSVDALAEAMPDIGEDNANTATLLFLNLPEADKTVMVNQIKSQKGNRVNQVALLNLFHGRLDKDQIMIPPVKEVVVVEDAFLKELRERLKNFGCLCAIAGFSRLRDLLRKIIEELKRANLFSVFTAKHPGIQHKAGVTLGGTFIVAYIRRGTAAPDKPDPAYERVAAGLPDGMVVADFYLPYLSYSNHPPVVYQVNDAEPIPDVVTLALQPNPVTGALRFSVGDGFPYAFSHVPNAGTLTNGTPANGVTTVGADNYIFTPSRTKALLGNDFKRDLDFEYVKRGVVSERLRVTVFNLPTVEIKAAKEIGEVQPGADITLRGTVNHADKFAWFMQDATGKSDEVAATRDLTGFNLPKEGTFTFTLRATQGETGAQAISNSITVKVRRNIEAPTKTCGNLLLIIEAFERLPAVDPERFKSFEATVLLKWGVTEFFGKLKEVATAPEAKQLEFFKAKMPNGSTLSATLEGWLQQSAEAALNERSKTVRLLALALYQILTELVLYLSCLRKEDVGKAEEQIFANMVIHLKGQGRGKGFLDLVDLTDPEKAVLAALRAEFEAEVKRNAVNNRVTPKPKYARVLKAVLASF